MITGNIKSLLQIKFKNRHDNYADQYNRIFMVKMAMISSMLLGLNWFKDTIRCTVPNFAQLDKGYIHQACWIQGMNNVFLRTDCSNCKLKVFKFRIYEERFTFFKYFLQTFSFNVFLLRIACLLGFKFGDLAQRFILYENESSILPSKTNDRFLYNTQRQVKMYLMILSVSRYTRLTVLKTQDVPVNTV